MKINFWFYCFIAIVIFEVFDNYGTIKSIVASTYFNQTNSKQSQKSDTINTDKKYNVLFFEADYGENSLGNGKWIFFVDNNKSFVLYSQFDSFDPNLSYGKIIGNKIRINDFPEDSFEIINNNLVTYSEYRSKYLEFPFISYLSTCSLEEIFSKK